MQISKSWVLTALPLLFAIGFSVYYLVTGHDVTPQQLDVIDKLTVLGLGTGSIGAAKAGHSAFVAARYPTAQDSSAGSQDTPPSPNDIPVPPNSDSGKIQA